MGRPVVLQLCADFRRSVSTPRTVHECPVRNAVTTECGLRPGDLDCGGIIDGLETVDEAGERIFRLMLKTASGHSTRSERHGYGQQEFVPWQLGAVM